MTDEPHYAIYFRDNKPTRYAIGTPVRTEEHPGWIVFRRDGSRAATMVPEADVLYITTVEPPKAPVINEGLPAHRTCARDQEHHERPGLHDHRVRRRREAPLPARPDLAHVARRASSARPGRRRTPCPLAREARLPRIRRNNRVPISAPREGRGELVKPERVYGSRGSFIPTGTRHQDREAVLRYEPIRNGLPPFVPYDPSPAARKARAANPRYAHARLAWNAPPRNTDRAR